MTFKKVFTTLNFFLISLLIVHKSFSQLHSQELKEFHSVPQVLELADKKLNQTLQELSFDPTLHPARTDTETGKWEIFSRDEWTSGYFAGLLWYMYKLTGNTEWMDYAQKWTRDMESEAYEAPNHDTGLKIYGSFGMGYRLTENPEYRKLILQGANSLSKRFNPKIGAIKSWEPWEELNANYPVIIDNMMNLELLLYAADHGGKDEWRDIAIEHAKTTHKNHFRDNGSVYHIVDFDDNGNVNQKFTIQGYDANSVWARGQAWAIYGFTMVYRYTQIPEFLDAATDAANYFIDNIPEDNVPWYDFLDPSIPNTTKDASAAAITASALFELYSFTDNPLYFNTAVDILNSLFSDEYSTKNSTQSSILKRCTIRRGDPERGLIYADYYFLEAIARYQELIGAGFPELKINTTFYLGQNYPNPFNGQTQFYYSVDKAGPVKIDLYNLAGEKIQTLFNGTREPGNYTIRLDASYLASGFYIYTLLKNGRMESKKMLLIK